MVHEIRNPLASTLWAVEMLARGSLGDPRSDRLAQLAARSIRRLRSLIEDCFALERVPAAATPVRIDLRAAIDRALAPHDIEPAGITATVDAAEHTVVNADPVLLDKLLLTCMRRLLHVGPSGPLSIQMKRETSTAELSISHTGSHVIDVDPPPLTPGGSDAAGTTFSLLLARALAQALNVALFVTEGGTGVTVRLVFPLQDRGPVPGA